MASDGVDADASGLMERTTPDPYRVVSVPGFGFFPYLYFEQLEHFARQLGIDQKFMNDSTSRDQARCSIVKALFDSGVMPVDYEDQGAMCQPMFDNASCFPATPPGQVVAIPCMSSYLGVAYNSSGKK